MQFVIATLALFSLGTTCSAKMLRGHSPATMRLVSTGSLSEARAAFNSSLQKPWEVDMSKYDNTATLSALIAINDEGKTKGTLGAFASDGEVRGVQETPTIPPFGPKKGKSIWQITIYGKPGDKIVFKFMSEENEESDLELEFKFMSEANEEECEPMFSSPTSQLVFQSNGNCGNLLYPGKFAGTFVDTSASGQPFWTFDPNAFANSMTLTALVKIDDTVQTEGQFAAFYQDQVRGTTEVPLEPPFGDYAGKSLYPITIMEEGNGEPIKFKFKPSSNAPPVELESSKEIIFTINGNEGSVVAPVIFTGTTATPCDDDNVAAERWAASKGWGSGKTCEDGKMLCRHNAFKHKLKKICKKTCGHCPPPPSPPCSDDDAGAGAWAASKGWGQGLTCTDGKGLCGMQQFKTEMTQYCSKTCDFCPK